MVTNTDFAKYLSRFLSEYLPHERNVSKNTINSYRDAFVQYIDYMRDVRNIPLNKLWLKQITRESVSGFLMWIMEVRKCGVATRNYRLAALHSFISYLQYTDLERLEEWQKILSIKAMKSDRPVVNYLTTEGIKLLLEQPDISTQKGRRHLAVLALMYDTGARVQEIADLTIGSVRITSAPYTIRLTGKGNKTRIVPLINEQVDHLKSYMEEWHLFDDNKVAQPLFCNKRHEKLTRSGISYILRVYAGMARILRPDLIPEPLSCHCIRHSKAMHLLQSGVNLVYIKDILGHVSIQTTDIYARADSKAKRDALEKAYSLLTPNKQSEREWERNKDLKDWLKGL